MWVNILKPGGTHSGHIHPHSIVSGTFYVAVPPGSGAPKLEDPRLPMLMAAPGRTDDAPDHLLPLKQPRRPAVSPADHSHQTAATPATTEWPDRIAGKNDGKGKSSV